MSDTQFAIRFIGGPRDGNAMAEGPWPPPEVWPSTLPGGRYERTSMSRLTDEQADNPHIMRGVVYEWRPQKGAHK